MTVLDSATPEDAGFLPERIALLDQRLQEWVDRGWSASTSVLVARKGKIALHKGYGVLTDEADSRAVDKDDIFPLASLQKVFTATAIMMEVEQGNISLNSPVTDYLPEVPAEWGNKILLHHLLTHTSGYFDTDMKKMVAAINGDIEVPPCPPGQHEYFHAALHIGLQTQPIKKPLERNIYSSLNFNFLAEILRRVTGLRIEQYMQRYIFDPLQMNSSFSPRSAAPVDRLVSHLSAFSSKPGFSRFINTPSGAAGIVANTMDLAVFCQTFLNGGHYGGVKLLGPTTVAEMTRNQIPGIGVRTMDGLWIKEATWGLGWMVQGNARWRYGHGSLQPVGSYYHQGGTGTAIWVDPIHDLVAVFLSTARSFEDLEIKWDFDLFQNLVMSALDD